MSAPTMAGQGDYPHRRWPLDAMPLAAISGTGAAAITYYVHADHLDRPVKMTDAAGASVWDAIYKPYGEVYAVAGTPGINLQFPGQWFQLETGLAYNWHRHFDATTGRYLSPDPLRFVNGPSVYAYAGNNPAMGSDPRGLDNPGMGPYIPDAPVPGNCGGEPALNPTPPADPAPLPDPVDAPDAPAPPNCPIDLGLGVGLGSGALEAGQPTLDKPGGVGGGGASGPYTSPASGAGRGIGGGLRYPGLKPIFGTPSVGGAFGRAVPVFGGLLMLLDALNAEYNLMHSAPCGSVT